MAKIILFVRASTDAQDITEQKNDMITFARDEGYSDEQMIIIEDKGASAIKLNEKYQEMIDQLKSTIENDPDVKAVAYWHLNRAFRNERVYIEVKDFLVQHGVQLLVKNPYLKLLNPDGSVNKGVELSLSLLSVMARQDMEEKVEKFKRTKKKYAREGIFSGGNTKKYGYAIDEINKFIPDPIDSKIVQDVYEKYATGKYTQYTLAKECEELGWTKSDGKPVDYYLICGILNFKGYTGQPDEKNNNRVYPQIISQGLYEKVKKIKSENQLTLRVGKTHRQAIAYGLGKCYICGRGLMRSSNRYQCSGNLKKIENRCDNWVHLRADVVEKLLFDVAQPLWLINNTKLNAEQRGTYKSKISDINQKRNTAQKKLDGLTAKRNRINELYLEMTIDSRERQNRLAKLKDEYTALQDTILDYDEQLAALQHLLDENIDNPTALGDALTTMTALPKQDIIKSYITRYTAQPFQLGEPDRRAQKPNAIKIDITTIYGDIETYYYVPCNYQGHNLYIYNKYDGFTALRDFPTKRIKGAK